MAEPLSELRSALRDLVRLDSVPPLPFLTIARARVRSQGVDGRVSLQMVDRGGSAGPEQSDTLPVPVWMGVPGCSADHTPGQEVVLAFARADGSDPLAFLATPKGQPGHVPIKVRFEATTELRFLGASAGVGRFGAGMTAPVALAAPVSSMLAALQTFAAAAAAAVTVPQVAAAAATLQTALAAISGVATTKLEAI